MPESINEYLHISDVKEYLDEVMGDIGKIDSLIIGYTRNDATFVWKGVGARTALLGLVEAMKYNLLKEVDQ